MTKNGKTGSAVLMRALLVTLCAVLVLSTVTTLVLANQPQWSNVDIKEEYDFGTVFTVPERTVTVGATSVQATHTVIYPDGTSTLNSKITLNISGMYTVSYQATVEGKPYVQEHTFMVADYLYYFDTDKSSAKYDAEQGLLVELVEGDTLHFNAVMDLRDIDMDDVLLEAFATPSTQGRLDFQRLYFTFTDVEDPNNYLTFSARHTASTVDAPYSYAMVAGNGQLLTGIENFNGELKKHVEGTSNFGRPFPHSFKDSTAGTVELRYDSATMTAYVWNQVIATLNDPTHFSNMWSGFTSGKVRLSVTAGMYEGTVARFCLKSVKDVDLSAGKMADTEGPVIKIDCPYTEEMPAAVKGGSYGVYPATARDANTGDCEVKVSVWYNYTSSNATLVDIVDGRFTTANMGNYAIVYEATDRLGNLTREVLWVYSHETVEKPTVTVAADHATELELGQILVPAECEIVSHSGDATVKITAKWGDEVVDITGIDYRPEKAGTYTVTYTATDYIGQTASASYEVVATPGATPVFVDTPVFPAVLIDGSQYKLPDLYANDYRSGTLERKLVSAELIDAEGTKPVAAGGVLIPKVSNNGDKVTVVYSCDGAELSVELPVIQVWYTDEESSRPKLNLENYLYSAEAQLDYIKNDASITVIAKDANASWLFGNQLVAENFEMILQGIAGKSNFTSLDVTLTDAENPAIAVTVKLINHGSNNVELQIGDVRASVAAAFELGSEFVLGYTEKQVTVGSVAYEILTDASGNAFNGFPSGKLMVSVSFAEAKNGAAYDLISVNGYAMSNLTSDRTGPKLVVLGDYGGSFSINQQVTIPAALAGDALDPNVTFTMTVKDPQGNVVTTVDGIKLDGVDPTVAYTIMLDQYGQYSVRLVAADTFNGRPNETVLPYTINVDDETAPEITYTSTFTDTAKVGDVLVMPSFTVSDNITAPEKIAVMKYVYTPSGRLILLEGASNSIKASQAGTYEFRIYVSDESGNMSLIRKTVTVTAN